MTAPRLRLSLALPFPPSVNNLFATVGRRRVPTARYKAWRQEADMTVMVAGRPSISGPVRVHMAMKVPGKGRADGDNLCKAPLDCLVRMGVIDGDDHHTVRALSWEWVEDGFPFVVTVESVDA